MFANFRAFDVEIEDILIHGVIGGQGPPLLLLHGYPQTHVIWHKMADQLAKDFTVVATDLRGYGDSGKPHSDEQHFTYSKRASAVDQLLVMQHFGFEQFYLVGHDRGGRVGHRMALDHPEAVLKLAVLDIAPTYTMYTSTDMEFAQAYYHWFFLIQPYDLPETLIGHAPDYYLEKKFGQWGRNQAGITAQAFAEYRRCFTPETIHASCEDYRASATIDLIHDQEDLEQDRKLTCPVLCLWGKQGFVGQKYDVIAEWSVWSDHVSGAFIDCGHYLPEESPEATYEALIDFLQTS